MTLLRCVVSVGCVALLAVRTSPAQVPAQGPVRVRGQQLVEITRAAANEVVSGMPSFQHGVAPARGGALFVLVTRTTLGEPGPDGGKRATSELELWRSDDRGASWRRANVMPTNGEADGSIVPDGDGLSCAWTSSNGGKWSNAFWQRYDVQRDQWLGEPVLLAAATGDEDQYFVTDLARARNGALVVAIGSHRSPPAPTWNCGWSTGMRWLRSGAKDWAKDWSPLQQVNIDNYGTCGNLLVRGDVVDFTYRTNPGWAVHGLRSFDTTKGEWLASEPITPLEPAQDAHIANVGVFCADGTGGRTLLHLQGPHEAGHGRLVATFVRDGAGFRTTEVASDPPLHAGNENPTHFTLARGPGNQVLAYFSKVDEDFAMLWQCVLEDGVPVGAPKVVVKGAPRQFVMLNGMRIGEAFSGLHLVVTSRTDQAPSGVVSVFGSWPAPTVWLDGQR